MIDRIRCISAGLKHFKLSPTTKTVLINSFLFSIPNYYLSIYPISDSVLCQISKIVRSFFWYKDDNGKGIHAVAWDDITVAKTKGGLAIRYLLLFKHSIIAKNAFKYINFDVAIWVDILHFKYGLLNFWRDPIPSCCSWFFRGLCYLAAKIKPFCWINSVNPSCTSLFLDSWCSESPLSLNPTYLNICMDFEHLKIPDFILDGNWDT